MTTKAMRVGVKLVAAVCIAAVINGCGDSASSGGSQEVRGEEVVATQCAEKNAVKATEESNLSKIVKGAEDIGTEAVDKVVDVWKAISR